jgi:uncharacterized RDD family membrane protein YckC
MSGALEHDSRDVITPHNFRVAPHLCGLPLASPWRRLLAAGVDGLLLAVLIGGGFVALGLLGLVFAIGAWRRRGRDGPTAQTARVSAGSLLAVLALVGGLALWDGLLSEGGVDVIVADDHAETVDAPAHPTLPSPPPHRNSTRQLMRDGGFSLLATLRNLGDDLGISAGWAALYFTLFTWIWNGQTPGKRLLGLRVIHLRGRPLTWWDAFERFGGYAAGVATGLIGYLQVFWDANRQALHDRVSFTAVIRDRDGRALQAARAAATPVPSANP